ncbi:hypothetical protein LPUS_07982 [Lasallia pustulata]|uniref:Uncharacterized protein n=1 Tax=Lasallia pustulata TaxID=136370 RepID=A0A1W5D4Y4_9LECA|nr:hypothetical protein LPUS_07982 [Lasallia pustulata]
MSLQQVKLSFQWPGRYHFQHTRLSLGLSSLIIGTETEKITLSTATKTDDKPAATIPIISGMGASLSYFTVGSETFAVGASGVIVDGKTLTPGSPAVTVSGLHVSLATSAFVVGTRTEVFTAAATGATSGLGATLSYVTVSGETFTLNASDVFVDGKTLTPGSPGITISGVRVSLGTSAFIVGTKTEILRETTNSHLHVVSPVSIYQT